MRFLNRCSADNHDLVCISYSDTAIALLKQCTILVIGVYEDPSASNIEGRLAMHPKGFFVRTIAGRRQADDCHALEYFSLFSCLGASGRFHDICNFRFADHFCKISVHVRCDDNLYVFNIPGKGTITWRAIDDNDVSYSIAVVAITGSDCEGCRHPLACENAGWGDHR